MERKQRLLYIAQVVVFAAAIQGPSLLLKVLKLLGFSSRDQHRSFVVELDCPWLV